MNVRAVCRRDGAHWAQGETAALPELPQDWLFSPRLISQFVRMPDDEVFHILGWRFMVLRHAGRLLGIFGMAGGHYDEWVLALPQLIAALALPHAADQVEPATASAQLFSQASILLAEDNQVNQLITQRMLEAMGCAVRCAANGQLALQLLAENHFSLVQMDVEMPVLDGLAAVRQMRQLVEHDLSHIPVIALTGNDSAEDRAHCLAAGMDDYLSKPIQPAQLHDKLEYWLLVARARDKG